jgi:hypothetical protein
MDKRVAVAVVAGIAFIGVCVGLAATIAHGKAPETIASVTTQATNHSPPSPKQHELTDETTLAGAIAYVAPFAGQPSNSRHSAAVVMLWGWAPLRLHWSDVAVTTDETSYAMAKKNVDDARGKRLCISGTIIEITESKLGAHQRSEGLIESYAGNLFSFMGVGSSGTIVQQSDARFCGVVVDAFDYQNSAGGTGHAIDVVGMFDIPENRPNTKSAPAAPMPTRDWLAHPKSVFGMPTYTTPNPTSAPTTTTASSEDCNPPYAMDANGHKIWKRGCM